MSNRAACRSRLSAFWILFTVFTTSCRYSAYQRFRARHRPCWKLFRGLQGIVAPDLYSPNADVDIRPVRWRTATPRCGEWGKPCWAGRGGDADASPARLHVGIANSLSAEPGILFQQACNGLLDTWTVNNIQYHSLSWWRQNHSWKLSICKSILLFCMYQTWYTRFKTIFGNCLDVFFSEMINTESSEYRIPSSI